MSEQGQTVVCWRCGNSRWAGPSWCGTCQAPEHPPVGFQQTYRGMINTPRPAPPPEVVARDKRRRRIALGIVGVVVVAVVATLAFGNHDDGSSVEGTLAAGACIKVVSAAREMAAGTRSLSSFESTVRSAEGDARSAAAANARYLPIAQAIVSLEDPTSDAAVTSLRFLAGVCP